VRIAVTTVYVDDQEKALSFHTDVLGFGNLIQIACRPPARAAQDRSWR
jgi:catechol 2,3-dioxygenase-like lactoylglutathione lyase family enzyme